MTAATAPKTPIFSTRTRLRRTGPVAELERLDAIDVAPD
jgi:hypothetical protein